MLLAACCRRDRGSKRDFPQQYSLQQLPHKKRVKHTAGGADGYGSYYSAAGSYGYGGSAGPLEHEAGGWEGAHDGNGAFKVGTSQQSTS